MTYVEAVKSAGAVPVVLPPLSDEEALAAYLVRLDGLVLVGGRDIPPEVYGEEPTATVVPMPRERWDFESQLLEAWLSTDKPVLGICLGSQFANVVQGGTLIQDKPRRRQEPDGVAGVEPLPRRSGAPGTGSPGPSSGTPGAGHPEAAAGAFRLSSGRVTARRALRCAGHAARILL